MRFETGPSKMAESGAATAGWRRLVLVADDLTGACDAAVAFTRVAQSVRVELSGRVSGDGVSAIQTSSRDVELDVAEQRLTAVAARLPDGAEVFKKVDSVFRGNTLAEIAWAARLFSAELVVVAPAYPAMGRRICDGVLHLETRADARRLAVLDGLREHGCEASLLPASARTEHLAEAMRASLCNGQRVLLCDAAEQSHLEATVRGARSLGVQVLWIGSGGLARALAADLPRGKKALSPKRAGGRVAMFVGSDHPVTLGQVTCLQRMTGLRMSGCDQSLPAGDLLLQVRRGETSAEHIRAAMAGIEPADVGCLFLTGGDTALQVCEALGIRALRLEEEFAPGVPMGIAESGRFQGVPVILKSGGFGQRDLLCDVLEAFAGKGEVAGLRTTVDIKERPTIAITLGDPAGVGAEVTLKALSDPEISGAARFIVLGDRAALPPAEKSTGVRMADLPVEFRDCERLPKEVPVEMGSLRAEYGAAAVGYVHDATLMCLQGEADAMVTAPLNKEAVTLSGMPFSGHTEYIAELCGATDSRMLLVGVKLSVVHVSTHISLREATQLNTERIIRTIELGNETMQLLGKARPRIAVCGLNPHAGEHGLFGTEDEQYIKPAVEACRARGIDCEGPVAPDTIFFKAARGSHDLVVAMYHDQGHIPMKLLDFEATVNMSLGIPILRTSVDHGTAFDIAGQNLASEANMKAAIRMAVTMAKNRKMRASV